MIYCRNSWAADIGGVSMSKRKLKLSVSGILFLIAIVLLMGAMVAVIVVLSSNCAANSPDRNASVPSAVPSAVPTEQAAAPSAEPTATAKPTDIPELDPIDTAPAATETSSSVIIAPTPASTASPTSSAKIYTKPSSAQKKAAKKGYVYKDKVNMRKGPGTNYDLVKKDIAKNTAVTLYEQQGDWWFLKCGNNYGYIRKDMIKTGAAPTVKPTEKPKSTATPPPGSFIGTVRTNSVVAFRESPSTVGSKVIRELKNNDKVIVYYKTIGNGNKEWYYCEYGGKKGYIWASFLKVPSGVPFVE